MTDFGIERGPPSRVVPPCTTFPNSFATQGYSGQSHEVSAAGRLGRQECLEHPCAEDELENCFMGGMVSAANGEVLFPCTGSTDQGPESSDQKHLLHRLQDILQF